MSSANNLAVVDGSNRSVMSFMKTFNRTEPCLLMIAYFFQEFTDHSLDDAARIIR